MNTETEKETKDEIIAKQQQHIDKLYDEIYTMRLTGEVKPIRYCDKRKKSFKRFLKRNEEFKEAIKEKSDNRVNDLTNRLNKATKIIEANGLSKSSALHITDLKYIRIATYMDNIEQLLNDIVNCKDKYYTLPNGYKVKPTSLRYLTFNQSLTCVNCGIKGRFLALEKCLTDLGGNEGEKEGQGFHLNLYGIDEMGREVLMTKDHIIPKSKGGPDDLSNMQTMCTHCNGAKGNKMPE